MTTTVVRPGGPLIYSPDFPPLAPNAEDDEFTGTALDPKWTELDEPAAHQAISVDNGQLIILDSSAAAGQNRAGLFQVAPSGDFTMWMKLSLLGGRTQGATSITQHIQAGIFFGEDFAAAPSTSAAMQILVQWTPNGNANKIRTERYAPFFNGGAQGVPTPTERLIDRDDLPIYLKLTCKRSPAAYRAAYSIDGIAWQEISGTNGTEDHGITTVVSMGIWAVYANPDAFPPIKVLVDWFRVDSSDASNAQTPSSQRAVG